MHSIFDSTFNGMGGSVFYRSSVIPELYPNHEEPPRWCFENWHPDDLKDLFGF